MPAFVNLTGLRFGRWLFVRCVGLDVNARKYKWLVRCDCGREKETAPNNITSGNSESCGCIRSALLSARSFRDLTGRKFGLLTVINCVGRTKNHSAKWLCRCDCGEETVVSSLHLPDGHTQTCGKCVKAVTQRWIFQNIVRPLVDDAVQEWPMPGSLLKFDIASQNLKFAIEYDGYQHEEMAHYDHGDPTNLVRRQRNDKRKTDWCNTSGWCLIRIPEKKYQKNRELWHEIIRTTIQHRVQEV